MADSADARSNRRWRIAAAHGFDFSLTFMTRALTTTVTNRALFDTIHSKPRSELEVGWNKLVKILDYLLMILPQKAFVHSTDDLNTSNALIPLVTYLASPTRASFPTISRSVMHPTGFTPL